jgi:hypothetical protein
MLLKLCKDFNGSDIVAKCTSLPAQESNNNFQEEYDESISREEKVHEEVNKENYGPTYVWGAGTSTFNVQHDGNPQTQKSFVIYEIIKF